MPRLKKILKISGIVIAVLLVALLTAPFLFKGKIVQAIKNTANEQLNATLDFDNDISLSFLRNFPNVSLGIDKLAVVGKDSFQGDTLVYLPELRLTLDVMSVISGDEVKIKTVSLIQPLINFETLRSGAANWDIVKTDTTAVDTSEGGTFQLALNSLSIEDGHLIYNDRSLDFYTELFHFNHQSKGDFTADRFTMETHTETPSLILGYGGINWLYQIKTDIDAQIGMDLTEWKFTYEKAHAKLNEVELESNGFVDLNDSDITMDIAFKALQNDFRSFLSLVPGMYSESFKDIQAAGNMGFFGTMTGKMTDDKMPATHVALNINNGSFRYPSLPYGADNIFLDLKYDNSDGNPDNSILNIDRLLARIAGETINLRLLLKTPISDPYIDASAKGGIDLGKFLKLIPLEKGTQLAGIIKTDLTAKGFYSSVATENYGKLDAKGTLDITNLMYQGPADKDAYRLDKLSLIFSPQKADLTSCTGRIGKNDFNVTGSVSNMLGYAFADETLQGTVNFSSNYMNINSLMGETDVPAEPTAADTGQLQIIELPQNLDVTVNTDIKKLIYDNYILTDLKGSTRLYDAKIDLKGLRAGILGGTVALDGTYDSKNIKNPFTELDTRIEQINLSKSFSYFPMLARFAPIAGYVDGLVNASIDMSSILDEKMQPNYSSMNVNGMVSFTDAAVKNLDVLNQIGKQLNVSWLQNLSLKNQQLKFSIKEGIFQLTDSLLLPLGQGAMMKLSGQSKLDKTVNYGGWIKIPRAALGAANNVMEGWVKQAATKGWDLKTEEMIPVDLSITGTVTKPVVKVSLKGFAQSVSSQIKDKATDIAKEEGGKIRNEALERAQAQADKIIQEANKRGNELRDDGMKAAEKVRQEGKRGADLIRKQGDDAYNRIMAETETAAKQAEARVAVPALKKAAGDKVRVAGKAKAEAARQEFYVKADQAELESQKKAEKIETETNERVAEIDRKAHEEADRIIKAAETNSQIK